MERPIRLLDPFTGINSNFYLFALIVIVIMTLFHNYLKFLIVTLSADLFMTTLLTIRRPTTKI